MQSPQMHFWKKIPVFRFILPFSTGILLQWYLQFPNSYSIIFFIFSLAAILLYNLFSIKSKFRFAQLNGFLIHLLLVSLGALLVWQKDIRNSKEWYGKHANNKAAFIAILQEPPVLKPNSYKALASVKFLIYKDSISHVHGNLIIYFKKEQIDNQLSSGTEIMIFKKLEPIKNAANPGGFDYERFSLFKNITHQVFLNTSDFRIIKTNSHDYFKEKIVTLRHFIIKNLRKYIHGEKERGLAEALLVGYKDDLDKNLVQAYSNTGVVHLIAISGLHVGLIYSILLFLTKKLKRSKLNLLRIIIILCSLWIFAFLAGAQPSVLRSALMFSLLASAQVLGKRSYAFNSLAFSAFILLCLNPFLLWDVGFQLSYAAVFSIMLFFRPIYNLLPTQNKILNYLWAIIAVTLAAQILTSPISMYHFHQFPLLFLPTNFIAVPLVSVILIGEVILTAIFFIEPLANLLGLLLSKLIYALNTHIERMNDVFFAVWDGIQLSVIQSVLLLVFAAGSGFWLIERKKRLLFLSMGSLMAFFILRTASFYTAIQQQKLIVYNVPKYQAIDIIEGRHLVFAGDDVLIDDNFLRNFHIKPSRILHRVSKPPLHIREKSFNVKGKNIVIADTSLWLEKNSEKKNVDLLVLSKNPKVYINNLHQVFNIKQIVADASTPAWKVKLWKKDSDSLQIPFHDVSEKGAFVMKL
jgi:competence protein ComEC